ncbi:MAG TPA: nucleoside phosphorylase [Actinomycetota bacterium]|nr:nucleoside phosphorylase [Actinomycetota bacterium]
MGEDRLPITRIPRRGMPERAIVVGDPARAGRVAELLEGAEQVASNREYVTYRGRWEGTELLVASHGVGAPGAMCMFVELALAGVRTFVRAGTCGALVDEIDDGHLVIALGAIRDDGVTHLMVPAGYPAVASPEVVAALQRAAGEVGHPWHRGLVWTKSMFFPGVLDVPWDAYVRAGAIAVEMELAALLVLASMRGLRAGGILTSDGNPTQRRAEEYDPHRPVVAEGVRASIRVALRALQLLAEGMGAPPSEPRPFVFR